MRDGDEATFNRAIVGFHRDAHGDWVAELACGHGQHVRHRPPWIVRPWVTTEEGRRQKLGQVLACKRCVSEPTDGPPTGASSR